MPTLGACYILDACGTDNADAALSLIASGHSFSYGASNQHGSWEHDASEPFEEGKLSGTLYFVQDAQKVDYFLINAKRDGETTLIVVPANLPGLTIQPDTILDLTRDQASLKFDQAEIEESQIVSIPGKAIEAMNTALPALLTLVCADMCGAAEWQLQTTAEYARTRKQFDRNLGFFQAVKHPLADFMVAIDLARSHLYNAVCAIDHEAGSAEQFARMAKSAANDAAGFGSKNQSSYMVVLALPGRVPCTSTSNASSTARRFGGRSVSEAKTSRIDSRHKLTTTNTLTSLLRGVTTCCIQGIHAETTPDRPAYIMAGSGHAVTFRELNAKSNQGAQLFRRLGLQTGDHIALCMENNEHFFQICWAAQRAGLYYTCISSRLTTPEIALHR